MEYLTTFAIVFLVKFSPRQALLVNLHIPSKRCIILMSFFTFSVKKEINE